MIEVTRLVCPANDWSPAQTHHLVPRGGEHNRHLVCIWCGQTERWLRTEAERNG